MCLPHIQEYPEGDLSAIHGMRGDFFCAAESIAHECNLIGQKIYEKHMLSDCTYYVLTYNIYFVKLYVRKELIAWRQQVLRYAWMRI